MKFTAIDFETANSNRSSICAVGLALVQGRDIIDMVYYLVRPHPAHFDSFNVSIHGITEADVSDAPTFSELWPRLWQKVDGPLVAHNASFDMSVLRHALDISDIVYPETDYFCTRVISKQVWPNHPTYALDYIAAVLGIEFDHHNAQEDARACAMIALRACQNLSAESLYDMKELCGLRVGALFPEGYLPCGSAYAVSQRSLKDEKLRATDLTATPADLDPNHPICGMSFVFTGVMATFSRRVAMQAVVDRGGLCHDSVKRDTDFLVLGQNGYIGYRAGHKSNKIRRAEDLSAKGYSVEILSERDFLEML